MRNTRSSGDRSTFRYSSTSRNRPQDRMTTTNPRMISIVKGPDDKITLNVDDLNKRLDNLASNASLPIRDLNGALATDFKMFIDQVYLLYGTDAYPVVYKAVKDKFGQLERVEPGTIGAFIGGCMVKTNWTNGQQACGLLCAGSVPPIGTDSEWKVCQNPVLWALKDQGNYVFLTLNNAADLNRAYIFINDEKLNHFQGFSEAEKKKLAETGIQEVMLTNYNADTKKYTNLTPQFISIDAIKTRPGPLVENNVNADTKTPMSPTAYNNSKSMAPAKVSNLAPAPTHAHAPAPTPAKTPAKAPIQTNKIVNAAEALPNQVSNAATSWFDRKYLWIWLLIIIILIIFLVIALTNKCECMIVQ